jgi:hypothetical protein
MYQKFESTIKLSVPNKNRPQKLIKIPISHINREIHFRKDKRVLPLPESISTIEKTKDNTYHPLFSQENCTSKISQKRLDFYGDLNLSTRLATGSYERTFIKDIHFNGNPVTKSKFQGKANSMIIMSQGLENDDRKEILIESNRNHKHNLTSQGTDMKFNSTEIPIMRRTKKLETIKNREKYIIRNKKLAIENEQIFPRNEYKMTNITPNDFYKTQIRIQRKLNKLSMELVDTKGEKEEDSNRNLIKRASQESIKSQRTIRSQETIDNLQTEDLEKLRKSIPTVLNPNRNLCIRLKDSLKENPGNNVAIESDRSRKDLNQIQNEIRNIRKSQFSELDKKIKFQSSPEIKDLMKNIKNKHLRKSIAYKESKDIYEQYKQHMLLKKEDFARGSKLYMLNNNPIFQINNQISVPLMLGDSQIMADLFAVNMFKLDHVNRRYYKQKSKKDVKK